MGTLWPHNTPATAENGPVPLLRVVSRTGSTPLPHSGDAGEWKLRVPMSINRI